MLVVLRATVLIHLLKLSVALPLAKAPPDDDSGGAEGEKEHRELDFPNTSVIPGDLTEELGVDYFFSLWTVLQDEDITTSDVPFTILAPSNLAKRPSQFVLGNSERLKKLILKHIILGQKILSSDIISSNTSVDAVSLDSTKLQFSHTQSGILVNNVRALKSDVFVPQGTIIVLEDYLPDDKEDIDEGRIPMIELGTREEGEFTLWKLEDIDFNFGKRVFEAMANESKPFYEELIDVLSLLQSGTSEFRRYLLQVNISQYFVSDGEYTAFIPMDDAFQKWYPIDWGFNPFEVPEFVKTTILNHIVVGKVKQSTVKDGGILTTLGGKQIIIKKNASKGLSLNGVPVFDGDTPTSHGNVWFVRDILFVDAVTVRSLQVAHKDKETAPLVTFPWYNSQFLSHVFTELEERKEFGILVDFLNATNEFADNLPSHDANFSMIRYSFFAPNDEAMKKSMSKESLLALQKDESLRKSFLMDHTVKGRFYSSDLKDGTELKTISEKTLKFQSKDGKLYANQVLVTDADIYIYNLGNMFVIDSRLFASAESKELQKSGDPVESPVEESNLSGADAEIRVTRQAPSPTNLFPRSRFLSMGLNILKKKGGDYQDMVEYWERTPEIEDDIVEQGVINKYTLFVPNDAGLRRYLLADAPNPFLISDKLRRNMLKDLIVKGNVKASALVDGATFTTLGGKTFTVAVTDGVINLGDRATVTEAKETLVWSFGALIFVDSPIFVDFDGMQQAIKDFHEKSPGKVRNPLVRPVNPSETEIREARQTSSSKALFLRSRFLSMGVGILKKKGGNYEDIVEYLEKTPQIEDDIVKEGVINKYTMFVPDDAGLRRYLLADAPNPFLISDKLRRNMLKDLIVKGNVKAADLVDGATFTTLGGKTFTVAVKDGVVGLGERATVTESKETLVWSFGAFIFVDSQIFVDFDGMQQAVKEYYQKSPAKVRNPLVRPVNPSETEIREARQTPLPTAYSFKSRFLSMAVGILKTKGVGYEDIVDYLEKTPQLEQDIVNESFANKYTMFVPNDAGLRRVLIADAPNPFVINDKLRRSMLKNLIVNGDVRAADLVNGAKFTTLGGKTFTVTVKNGVVSLGDRATVIESKEKNVWSFGYLIFVDSQIFVDFDGMQQAIKEYYQKNPPIGPFGVPAPAVISVPAPKARSATFEKSAFLSAALAKLKGVAEAAAFVRYLEQTPEFENELIAKSGNDYTLIVPSSWGIRRWVPADAVDPFYVSDTLRKQMLADHMIIGRVKKEDLVDGAQFTTLSGKTIGVQLRDGQVSIGERAIVKETEGLNDDTAPFLTTDSLIFVDRDAISNAIREHYKKSPPRGPFGRFPPPSPLARSVPVAKFSKSAFLSAAFEKLKNVEDAAAFRDYLDQTEELENDILARGGLEYTLVVPSGWGITRWLPADSVDPFYVNPALRKAMIADHVIIGRIKKENLVNGTEFITLSGKTVTVKLQEGQLFLGDLATVTDTSGLNDDTAPFLTTDSLILVDNDAISHAINSYREENPSSGPFNFAPSVAVEAMSEPSELQPDALFPSSPFLARTYENIQKNDNFATFRRYLEKGVQLEEELRTAGEQAEFTMVIPDNFGIIRWLAQDAADPFSVSEPLRKQMVSDHVVRGKLRTADLQDGASLTTLSGKQIAVKVVDGAIHLGDRATVTSTTGLEDATAPYITTDSMLFINFDAMQEALREYHEKNPVKTPWFSVDAPAVVEAHADGQGVVHPFVQQAQAFFLTRQQQEDLTAFKDYLARSDKLSQKLFELEAGTPAKYTLFAPVTEGISKYLPSDVADVYVLDSDYRHEMILDHIVPQKIEKEDMIHGARFESLNGKSITTFGQSGSPILNEVAEIVSGPHPLGDDGYLYITNNLLFFDFDKLNEALGRHNLNASLLDD